MPTVVVAGRTAGPSDSSVSFRHGGVQERRAVEPISTIGLHARHYRGSEPCSHCPHASRDSPRCAVFSIPFSTRATRVSRGVTLIRISSDKALSLVHRGIYAAGQVRGGKP